MAKKTTPWTKIKAEYLSGVTPKELADKYDLTAKQISDKANKDKWVEVKAEICEKVRESTAEKISRITNLALDRLEEILSGSDLRPDFVSAIGKAIDISGLKTSKREITGKDGQPFVLKEYILPEEVEKFQEHYKQTMEQ